MKTIWHVMIVGAGVLALGGCMGGAETSAGDPLEAPYGDPIVVDPTVDPQNPVDPTDPTGPVDEIPVDGPGCKEGRTYTSIGGKVLVSTRDESEAGLDRRRVKPFSALGSEYQRALGTTPALLASSGSTFGQPAARWYQEPQLSAVSLFTAFRIAFQGCLNLTSSAPEFAALPEPTTATAECGKLALKFWSREASASELGACTKVAVEDSVTELQGATTVQTSARRRWAYACATLLTTSGFLSY